MQVQLTLKIGRIDYDHRFTRLPWFCDVLWIMWFQIKRRHCRLFPKCQFAHELEQKKKEWLRLIIADGNI